MLSVVRTDTLSRGCADPSGRSHPWAKGMWLHRCPHRLDSPRLAAESVLPPRAPLLCAEPASTCCHLLPR